MAAIRCTLIKRQPGRRGDSTDQADAGLLWPGRAPPVGALLLAVLVAVTVRGSTAPGLVAAAVIHAPAARLVELAVAAPGGMGDMVFVPGGAFAMGSPAGHGYENERPQHLVALGSYHIDRTEVTNAMFARFVAATGYETDAEKRGIHRVRDLSGEMWRAAQGVDWRRPQGLGSSIAGLDHHPVVQVSWRDATAFCAWAGKRLPTEAEWEKAARGADGRSYPWGNPAPAGDLLNLADSSLGAAWADTTLDDGYRFAAPVGSYPAGASPYGALDMAGNVWEWVADRYDGGYYARSPSENPQGPGDGRYRVVRGGSWCYTATHARSAFRWRRTEVYRGASLGFRCARS